MVVAVAVRNLPADHRPRYAREFAAELSGMQRRAQTRYAVALLLHSWELADALSSSGSARGR